MSKIFGEKATIDAAKAAGPGDKTVLINWDAIAELPDQYEVIISEVKFDPKKIEETFSDVGNGNFMPTPAMHYKIAEAKGISGGENSILEPIYETVDLSEMTMASAPDYQKILVGYRCKKFSKVMEEDGTLRRSSACTIDYNVWNRISGFWANEEKQTEGYSNVLQGEYTYYGKKVTGPHIKVTSGKYTNDVPLKYDNRFKRKVSFKEELKFAMQKAETKAHEKTIRELAGLMTGYRKEDLTSGRLIFAKVRRSREILQAESAANLSRISKGIDYKPVELLWDDSDSAAIEDQEPEIVAEPETTPFENYVKPAEKSAKDRMLEALNNYDIPKEMQKATNAMIEWLNKANDPESQPKFWDKAIQNLKNIESDIPSEYHLDHKLYTK